MASCTFFGHRDCPILIKPKLYEVLTDLIENHAVNMLYIGRQGAFDAMVYSVLKDLELIYTHIHYTVVLECIPHKQEKFDAIDHSHTMLPEGIEYVHPRFAISWRNRWMLEKSDFVVTYITHSWGGAAQYAKIAQRQKKTVINLA